MKKPKKKKALTRLELKAKAIAECKDRAGRIRPENVVAAARHPNSILHNEFEWDDAEAAARHRMDRARQLIREVKLVVTYHNMKVAVPFYVSDVTDDSASYVEVARVAKKASVARKTLKDEMARIQSAIRRGHALAIMFNLEATFEKMLHLAIEVERRLDDGDAEAAE
jgi:hypothetical protein